MSLSPLYFIGSIITSCAIGYKTEQTTGWLAFGCFILLYTIVVGGLCYLNKK